MTKAAKIALGIAAGGLVCGVVAVGSAGVARLAWTWTAISCAVACAAYVINRPTWLGKRDGRLSARTLVVLPYLTAVHIACGLMRWWRGLDAPSRVVPGLWVAGRIGAGDLPPGVTHVVDLVAEYSARRAVRALPGYRSLPILDGGVPPDLEAYGRLVRELAAVDGDVLVHCDSGRGRAPTMAAALLIARGIARDVDEAVALVQRARPVASANRSERAFLAALCAMLPRSRAPEAHAAASPVPG